MASRNCNKIRRFAIISRNYSKKKEETSSIWDYFKSNKKEVLKPPKECCRKRQGTQRESDPDFSCIGGEPYRTCGSAYIIQKDLIPDCEIFQNEEDRILKNIEADLSNKNNLNDPMPPFRTVEQRLLDLNERRLHPYYKKYMSMPKKLDLGPEETRINAYKCKTGPIYAGEIPDNFKFNKELMDRKNIFADFKQVELPKQLVVRMLEMDKNRKPTLERKKEEKKEEAQVQSK